MLFTVNEALEKNVELLDEVLAEKCGELTDKDDFVALLTLRSALSAYVKLCRDSETHTELATNYMEMISKRFDRVERTLERIEARLDKLG